MVEKSFQRRWTPIFEINDVVEVGSFDDGHKMTVLEIRVKASRCLRQQRRRKKCYEVLGND